MCCLIWNLNICKFYEFKVHVVTISEEPSFLNTQIFELVSCGYYISLSIKNMTYHMVYQLKIYHCRHENWWLLCLFSTCKYSTLWNLTNIFILNCGSSGIIPFHLQIFLFYYIFATKMCCCCPTPFYFFFYLLVTLQKEAMICYQYSFWYV